MPRKICDHCDCPEHCQFSGCQLEALADRYGWSDPEISDEGALGQRTRKEPLTDDEVGDIITELIRT